MAFTFGSIYFGPDMLTENFGSTKMKNEYPIIMICFLNSCV